MFTRTDIRFMLMALFTLKYGSTRVDVNIDGSFSYAEHPNDAKENGKFACFEFSFCIYSIYNSCKFLLKFLNLILKEIICY